MPQKPLIGITMGDPKGISPEIILKAVRSTRVKKICRPLLFGDPLYFDFLKTKKLSPQEAGALAYFYLTQGIQAAQQKKIAALVTAPLSKAHLNLAGVANTGQTEILAQATRTKRFAMMLAGCHLRVTLVTRHIPLSKVSAHLSCKAILEAIELTHEHLRKFEGIRKPRIGVAGLNPHAGDSGLFGSEEARVIRPAVSQAQRKKIDARGPYPADTLFYKASQGDYDAVIAMYHDQGLIPLKLLHFDTGVNITLGLPFIRTSPDHGTAFDIAGKGLASAKSMIAAIEMAVAMINSK